MLVELETFAGGRGKLTVVDGMPFAVKRAFWVWDAIGQRGGHGHLVCEQVMVAVHGIVSVVLDGEPYVLTRPDQGLYIPAGSIVSYSCGKESVCLVLCSERYDPDDYVKGG